MAAVFIDGVEYGVQNKDVWADFYTNPAIELEQARVFTENTENLEIFDFTESIISLDR